MPTVEQLLLMLAERDRVIEELRAEVAELKRQLGQNSGNSSRPLSGDRLQRSPSRVERGKAGRKPGKQPGGEGFALWREAIADRIEEYRPSACGGCGGDLAGGRTVKIVAWQVCDLPEVIAAEFIEHRVHSVRCGCGHVTAAAAPAGVGAPVSYGPRLRALASDLVLSLQQNRFQQAASFGSTTSAALRPGTVTVCSGRAAQISSAQRAPMRGACLTARAVSLRFPVARMPSGPPQRDRISSTAGCATRGPRTRSRAGWMLVSRPRMRLLVRVASTLRRRHRPGAACAAWRGQCRR